VFGVIADENKNKNVLDDYLDIFEVPFAYYLEVW